LKGGDLLSKKNKQYVLEIKSIDEQNMIIDMVGSTSDVDRVGDIVVIDGVDYSDYMKNPIVLPNHDYSSQAIGKTLNITRSGNKLIFKIQFASTEMGKEWFYLYSKGFMSSSSIGFIPIEYKPNDSGGYTYTKIQLLEISLVTVPCQQNANIIRAFEGGHISKALFDMINKNNEEDSKNMKVKEVQALIDRAVNAKSEDIKKNYENDLNSKSEEITKLKEKISDLEKQLEGKGGASHSKSTIDTVNQCCKGIEEHIKKLRDMVSKSSIDDEPDGDEEKEYTDEEISKMIEENVQKTIEAYSK
jgi:HK97 family phage prohead protease